MKETPLPKKPSSRKETQPTIQESPESKLEHPASWKTASHEPQKAPKIDITQQDNIIIEELFTNKQAIEKTSAQYHG